LNIIPVKSAEGVARECNVPEPKAKEFLRMPYINSNLIVVKLERFINLK